MRTDCQGQRPTGPENQTRSEIDQIITSVHGNKTGEWVTAETGNDSQQGQETRKDEEPVLGAQTEGSDVPSTEYTK